VAAADGMTLTAAFTALRERLAASGGSAAGRHPVNLVLLPPLVEARLVSLPPLRPGEATTAIARDPRRHFIGAPEGRVVGASDRPRGSSAPSLAVSASASLVDALNDAAASAGWQVDRVVAGHGAWAAAGLAAGAGTIAVSLEHTVHVIQLDSDGQPTALRRFPVASLVDAAAAVGAAPAMVVAEDPALRSALAAAGQTVTAPTSDPALLAALHAFAAVPTLVTPAAVAGQAARGRQSVSRLVAAALLLLVAASALELWGVRRELEVVAAERQAIRPNMPALLELSDSLTAVQDRRAAIRQLSGPAPSITPALMDVALLLPDNSYLTRLRARGDTITIEAVGAGAAAALESLQGGEALRDVRLQGTVTREIRERGGTLERFTLSARIVPLESGSAVAPEPAKASFPSETARSRFGREEGISP
jgi:hypothetical protein